MNNVQDGSKLLAWVTGADGLIGSHIKLSAPFFAPTWKVRGLNRNDFDLTDFEEMQRQFEIDRPALVIHCAALSDPEACELKPAKTRLVNRDSTFFLSRLSEGIPMIFFSSDLVFDGRIGNYNEEDEPSPLSFYAQSKAEAEVLVLSNPMHTVVRTSLTSGQSPKRNRGIEEQLKLRWSKGETVRLFEDEFRKPIAAKIIAQVTWELVAANQTGLFHLAGSERMSRYEIGRLIADMFPELNPKIKPCSLSEHKGVPRPADTSLNCAKLSSLLSFPVPSLRESFAAT